MRRSARAFLRTSRSSLHGQACLTWVLGSRRDDRRDLDRDRLLAATSLGTLFYLGSRIDALAARMDAGFARVDAGFGRVDARFDRVDAKFDRVDARFDAVDARLDALSARIDSHVDRHAS